MIIQYEEIFYDKLKTGINLFTGAGFSVLPSPSGKCLPVASDLENEICRKFNITNLIGAGLELISMQASRLNANGFDTFLRERYRVDSSNPLYDVINRININAYITTNIDNLFQTIVAKDARRYVNSIINGKAKRTGNPINYIPLHGDITDSTSKLYFGELELSQAASENAQLFTVMKAEIQQHPTLFWGYGFHDSSVMTSIGSIMQENKNNIWIQFREQDRAKSEIYKSLGFNIIIADTEELLIALDKKLPHKTYGVSSTDAGSIWNSFLIPTENSLTTHIAAADYFNKGIMGWNVIFSKYPYDSCYVREAYERYLKSNNLVIIGTPQCGKTTLLRQLAIAINEPCYYISEMNEMLADKLSKVLTGKITVFVDDCASDMNAFAVFAKNSNIHLVGVADEYSYESSKHLLANIPYTTYLLPDVERSEANLAYEHISLAIKKSSFTYSKQGNEKYSFWEFSIDNIRDIITMDKVKKFLLSIDDKVVREILFLTTYLTQNGSYLSTDVLWFYFKAKNYATIKSLIGRANEALSRIDESIVPDLQDQDYYSLRSHNFAKYIKDIAIDLYREEFGNVIRKNIENVPRGVITRYYVYRRTAYDASLFFKVFVQNAEKLYDKIYALDESFYTLQQKALYLAKCYKFSEAFALIDKASLMLPRNFSIKNAKAIITFEANKNSNSQESRKQLDNAMAILTICYHSDKRKTYHAQKFAEYALFIYKQFGDNQYLGTAQEWLNSIISEGAVSKKTSHLIELLKREF